MARNNSWLRTSLFVGFLCGIAGVLVDIDHPIANYTNKELDGRFLHTPILVISSVVFCFNLARIGRLYNKKVLRRKNVSEIRLRNKAGRSGN